MALQLLVPVRTIGIARTDPSRKEATCAQQFNQTDMMKHLPDILNTIIIIYPYIQNPKFQRSKSNSHYTSLCHNVTVLFSPPT